MPREPIASASGSITHRLLMRRAMFGAELVLTDPDDWLDPKSAGQFNFVMARNHRQEEWQRFSV
jgi:hypothetical protein